ncbi:MAG: T9SS type A sorting domain-containing protein [Bacteroidota bacterium]
MKKQLLTSILLAPGFLMAQTTLISVDFDNLTAGNTVAATSGGTWETWSGTTPEDAFVSNTYSSSPSNSMNVYNNGPSAYLHDMVLPFPSTYTTGLYEFKFKLYVPSGNGAYFNLGGAWTSGGAGYQYGIDVFFNTDGSGNVNTASTSAFTYTPAAWNDVSVTVNPGAGTSELKINSTSVFTGAWGAASGFGVADIFGIAFTDVTNATQATANFYVDDVILLDWTGVGVAESTTESVLNIFPNPNEGQFTIQMNNAEGNYSVNVADVLGKVVYSASVNASGLMNHTIDMKAESGIYFVTVSDGKNTIQQKMVVR